MKAKRIIALVVVMVMAFSLAGTALAIPSPEGSSAEGGSNVLSLQILGLPSGTAADLLEIAKRYIRGEYGSDFTGELLFSGDVQVTRTDKSPVTLTLNVAGAKVGDTIVIVHQKADGSTEIIMGRVIADGYVQFTLSSFSPICIVRVVTKGAAGALRMPKTGDNATAAPMAMLLLGCVAVLAVCRRALRKGE